MKRHIVLWWAALIAGVGGSTLAHAQSYPAKPIRLIVPFPPGGIYDGLGRVVSDRLSAVLGQQTLVDNRVGAGGVIGTELAAKAAPDGYTIVVGGSGPFAIVPGLYRKLPYDPMRDFAPIGLVGSAKHMLAVHPSVPAKSVKQLIALARAKPGALNFGSGGNGTLTHLAGELFNTQAQVKLVHVPYKGSGGSVPALLGGEVDMLFDGVFVLLPHRKTGKLRALAVTSKDRSPLMSDVPTLVEAGVPDYDVTNWVALYAPTAVPPAIVERLNAELVKMLREPGTIARLSGQGVEAASSTPQELAEFTRREIAKWAAVVKASGARIE